MPTPAFHGRERPQPHPLGYPDGSGLSPKPDPHGAKRPHGESRRLQVLRFTWDYDIAILAPKKGIRHKRRPNIWLPILEDSGPVIAVAFHAISGKVQMQWPWAAGVPVCCRRTCGPAERRRRMVRSVPARQSLFRMRNGTVRVCGNGSGRQLRKRRDLHAADTRCAWSMSRNEWNTEV